MTIDEMPVGSDIIFGRYGGGELVWRKVDDENTLYLRSEAVGTLPFDGKEHGSSFDLRQNNGNNEYMFSNIDQFLNQQGCAWFIPSHETDEMDEAYAGKPAFLSEFLPEDTDLLGMTRIQTMVTTGKEYRLGVIDRLVWLPSVDQLAQGLDGLPVAEDVYNDIMAKAHPGVKVLTRTGAELEGSFVAVVQDGNANTECEARERHFVFPCCRLSQEAKIEQIEDGLYTVYAQNQLHEINIEDLANILKW